jgi:hypothetical protein
MAIIELNRKRGIHMRNDYANVVRVAFALYGINKKGQPKIAILINIGIDLMKESGLKPTDKISLEIDTDNPNMMLIKRCRDGYGLISIGSSYKSAITWKFPIPNNDRSVKVVRHEIVDKGIRIYLENSNDMAI